MSFRERFKGFKDRAKEKARRVFESSPVQSTHSLPDDPPPTIGPAPEFLIVPATLPAPPRPISVPPGDGSAAGSQTWTCLDSFLRVLTKSSSLLGPLKAVMDDLSWCVTIYENAAMAQKDYQALKMELEASFSTLSSHFAGDVPPTMTLSMNSLCSAIEKELDRISRKQERGTGRRLLEGKKEMDEVMACYRHIQGHLDRLMLNADLSTWKIVDEQATENRLKSLAPSLSAFHNSAEAALVRRRGCTPNTRKQVLADLSTWRHDRNQGKIYWLNGMAGTGKTTIASSLCAMLDQSHELGASFFCTRQLPECRNVKLILPTIAYQLARFSRPFRCALFRALEQDPDVHARALPNQLDGMILGPLREVAHTLPADLVVVIDALDECDDSNGVGQMLEMLVKHATQLPIKVFVSSRPEPQIRQKIGGMQSQLVLHELDDKIVKGDIEVYLRAELELMSLSDSQLAALVERAGVLFIYAATVVRYIGEEDFSLNPKKRLETVLGAPISHPSNKNRDIDELYNLILSTALDSPQLEPPDKDRIELVLHTIICAREPLTVDALAGLLQLDDAEQVHSSLRRLWSVLHISTTSNLVSTLHASFPDYMLDPQRSGSHGCDAKAHHGRMVERCFSRVQNNERQFNICELESSYAFDDQVPNLEERVNRAIPTDLEYACQYWAVHLEMGGWSSEQMRQLGEFLSARLLLWMEVLNLRKRIHIGPTLLEKARKWCMSQDDASDTKDLVNDAWRFVTSFSANPVCRSTPHIYVSMLASWPRSRLVAERYVRRTKQLVEVEGTAMARRRLELLGVFDVGSRVRSVAFSSDGTRIVSGCDDGTIRVSDAQSGQLVAGPLEGHTDWVNSVTFSPDGTRIVSGSEDKTMRMWDARGGQMVLGPLEGHTQSVLSVAFSPDGARIVSGSIDETLRVWDAKGGHMVLGPLEGHSSLVNSVAFSSDGSRIVSGSWDKTIRVWDAQGGQMVLGPLEGHTGYINSVAFSPNDMRIVSGSSDQTIRVWDVQGGHVVLGPLEGHTGSVYSVAFSPDGICIVSGSGDNTIRVWDAQSGQMVLGPLEGHTDQVYSVAFSPDGTRIVSGSGDWTIRVWDAKGEQTDLGPLEGHTSPVYSVAFSPDGMHIVSCSIDMTIWVWDVQGGRTVLGPLKGHARSVCSVAFSPDSMRIVSGSEDGTIQVWDVQGGRIVLGPLEGHTSWVYSVAFSPDGMRIVSGSWDKTIRVWDAQGGQVVLGPLEGHTGWVRSVAFSPDGMRIVSGSGDQIIRVWDVQGGQMVLGPLEGHTGWVYSVAFSPDGTRIVSGSGDNTIRVWDAQGGQMVLGPLKGHTWSVSLVAFSPDGTYIVSGSWDKTIRVWEGQGGQMVLGPLAGHTAKVNSVAFSPDGTHITSCSDDQVMRVWRMPQNRVAANQPPRTSTLMSSPASSNSSTGIQHSVLTCPSSPSWEPDENGWVLDENQHILLWVPHDLRDCLLSPLNTFLISTRGTVRLGFDHANIGESWMECYSPA